MSPEIHTKPQRKRRPDNPKNASAHQKQNNVIKYN